MFLKLLEYSQENTRVGVVSCKTYLLHALLRLYFSLGKTLKNFFINYVLLENVKCKVMLTEAYLEPS